jgi:hypothetical protein
MGLYSSPRFRTLAVEATAHYHQGARLLLPEGEVGLVAQHKASRAFVLYLADSGEVRSFPTWAEVEAYAWKVGR